MGWSASWNWGINVYDVILNDYKLMGIDWKWTDDTSPIQPSSPAPTPVQQNFPSSAYGQTIPVIYGKARVPGAYIWAIPVKTATVDGIVTKTLTARLRFARPLVANSNWRVRRVWSNGELILNRATGLQAPFISYFRDYDGQNTQDRDPVQIDVEGETNISAGRGYLDIVITMDIGAEANAPPTFDAEWIQDPDTSVEVDNFSSFFSNPINTFAAPGSSGLNTWYGISSTTPLLVRRFNSGLIHEVSSVPLTQIARAYGFVDEQSLRYIPTTNRLIALAAPAAGYPWYAILINPISGVIIAESIDYGTATGLTDPIQTSCCINFANGNSVYIGTSTTETLFIFHATTFVIGLTYRSGVSWDSYTNIRCIAPGAVGGSGAIVWICADNKLIRMGLSTVGNILSKTIFATFADDLVYAVFHNGNVIVWTDAAQAISIDAITATTNFTADVPYQIEATGSLRDLAPPDMNRLTNELFYQEANAYNWTDLNTGETRSVSKGSVATTRYVYDGARDWLVTTDNGTFATRTFFDAVGEGLTRDLEDFLAALTEVDDGFTSSQHTEININDQIQGAVIDATNGVRDIARSVAMPYSIAIFERAGVIVYKRANTDGSFAIDATLSSVDFTDRGGQAIRATRQNPEEFIARYGINYRDPDEVYQPRPQYGEIQFIPFPVSPTDIAVKADIPIIASGTVIKTLATKKVNRLSFEKHQFIMTLRAKYGDLEPEDIINFTYAGRSVDARILETTLNPDFTIEVKATEFLSKVDATVTGASGRPIVPVDTSSSESEYYHLDIPLQEDVDDTASTSLVQYHVLTSQGQSNWDGATLYRREGAGSYIPVASQTDDGLVLVALSALPDTTNPYVTEFTRTLNVGLLTGDSSLLVTKTYLEVMNGANKFAIGAPGRWEICHVIGITNNGDNTFTFTGLVRGRGVSEEHTGTHQAGDFVVWLSDDNVQHLDYSLTALDETFSYKPVGINGNITDIINAVAVDRTVTGEAEKIPKPCQLDAVIHSPDVHLTWVRRGRFGVIWDDDGDFTTPLGETLEQYVIRIKNGPGGTVLRTVTVDDATIYSYSTANQTTDFGSPLVNGNDLTFDIRQVSGSGVVCPTREATITL